MKIYVGSKSFGTFDLEAKGLLEDSGHTIAYDDNPLLAMPGAHGIIAGTELYDAHHISLFPNLRVISRIGAGFNNIDQRECDRRDIVVTYTPDAPADAVAELTVALILNLFRGIVQSHASIGRGEWLRPCGTLLRENTVGVLGVGRIGKRVIRLLGPFGPRILGCDLEPDTSFGIDHNITWVSLQRLLGQSNLVTVHVPLNKRNHHLLSFKEIPLMKPNTYLVNTSRGPIVDESIVAIELMNNLAGYATDVFEREPYNGVLTGHPKVVLTAHIGAQARQSRILMEIGAVEDCLRVLAGESPNYEVPHDE